VEHRPSRDKELKPMDVSRRRWRVTVALAMCSAFALVAAGAASGHARVSPAVSLSNELQLYSLAVPTEKEGTTTRKVVLTVPHGFSIDSFVPSPGWKRVERSTGSGENTVIQQVTWTGGNVPTADDALFQFLGEPSKSGSYTFHVQQTYSDGSIVDWAGPESSDAPAPVISAKSSFGGGGSSTLAIIALVVGSVGIVVGATALVSRSGRQLA
jgi:uncharacterized protein YcnI